MKLYDNKNLTLEQKVDYNEERINQLNDLIKVVYHTDEKLTPESLAIDIALTNIPQDTPDGCLNAFLMTQEGLLFEVSNVVQPKVNITYVANLLGPQGERGFKGDKGDQGIQGVQGIQGIQGEIGNTGTTPNITITAKTIASDLQPTVVQGGTPENPTFELGIPQGPQGERGPAGKVTSNTFDLENFILPDITFTPLRRATTFCGATFTKYFKGEINNTTLQNLIGSIWSNNGIFQFNEYNVTPTSIVNISSAPIYEINGSFGFLSFKSNGAYILTFHYFLNEFYIVATENIEKDDINIKYKHLTVMS